MINLNYENTLVSAVGSEGISPEKLESLKKDGFRILEDLKEDPPGFMQLPLRFEEARDISARAASLKGFKNLVVLGIGGSALGNITLHQALNDPYYNLRSDRPGPRLFVLDNSDPAWTESLARLIDVKETLFNVITKSGSTAETLANFFFFLEKLKKETPDWKEHIVITTGEKGFLREFADENSLRTFPVPEPVGGRYSVLSEVGLLPAAICGIDILKLLEGASDAMENEHVPVIYAALQYYYYKKGKNINVFMPYSKRLESAADWFRQLWAESLGKNEKTGPTPVKALGATDQHSQMQLYMEGPRDKIITFLTVNETEPELRIDYGGHFLSGKSIRDLFNAESRGSMQALTEASRPNMCLEIPEVNAYHTGELIYQLEAACVIAGRMFGVDPFDQPGVELGKKLAYQILGTE